jgi:hypothetical protein
LQEDLSKGSQFYAYAVSALVHDTLISTAAQKVAHDAGVAWLVPQVVYGTRDATTDSTTYGIPHNTYVINAQSEDDKCIAFPANPVTHVVFAAISNLSKFEHPVPALPKPPAAPSSSVYPNYDDVMMHLNKTKKPKAVPANSDCEWITVCMPLHDMSKNRAQSVAEALDAEPNVKAVRIAIVPITDRIAMVLLKIAVSK